MNESDIVFIFYLFLKGPYFLKKKKVGAIASLVAQMVKRLPAMWETRVRFLGWEDPGIIGVRERNKIPEINCKQIVTGYNDWIWAK